MKSLLSRQERDPQVALFDALFEAHQRAVYAYHLGRSGDVEAAADLLQETFFRVWRHIEKLATLAPEEQRFWVFRCARNLIIDHYRRAPQPNLELDEETSHPLPHGDPAQTVENLDLAARVQHEMQRLPEELRLVLTLQVMGGLNSTQIGQQLDKPAGTVRYQISEARRLLAERLKLETE